MNIYPVLLELIEIRFHPMPLQRVLESLGTAVQQCDSAIDQATKSQDADYLEAVVGDECAVLENLLGAAFVTCQAEITAVVSHAMRIHADAKAQGHNLSSSDGTKNGILSIGQPIPGSTHTNVQVIDAFANYFKHCEEWDQSWTALAGRSKQTMDVISAMGAVEYGTGNLRAGVAALGIPDYKQLQLLSDHVVQWARAVKTGYESELRKNNLL
ncbi:MAG: hypothetical protein AAB370_11030 [Verrucomicrobiota bacterium]